MDKHDTLLISSGSKKHRALLRNVFRDTFHLLEASNAQQTILLLNQNIGCIAAVLLDITDMKTVDVPEIHKEQSKALLAKVPIIILSENDDPDVLNRAFGFGASDVIPMGYDPYAMLHRVENIIDLHLHKQHLETMVEEQKNILRHTGDTMVDALSSIIEYRSVESGQHILRIRHFTKILLDEVSRVCPEYGLTEEIIAIICSASALHDIGKIAIPDSILMKPGKLTAEEWEVMKTHAVTGCHILDSMGDMADREYLRYAHNICHYHHERWDGMGYPDGLAGDDIPICAQVVGLADAYDALTSKRVYKEAFSYPRAVNMILRGECGKFSPKLLECFKNVSYRFEELAAAYADGLSPKTESFATSLPAPKQDPGQNALERIRGKYFALVHYINGLLIELDLDRQLFHLIYNPYPGLARLQDMDTVEELKDVILQIIHPEDRENMEAFLKESIPRFLEDGMRRSSYRFRISSVKSPEGEPFEVTLLRINPLDTSRRTLAALVRKAEAPAALPADDWIDLLTENVFCCRNDGGFTLVNAGSGSHILAGYTTEEIRERFGGRLLELVHPDDREGLREEFSRQLKYGAVACLEYRIIGKDGSVHWLMNRSRMVVGRDGEEYLYSFLLDITHTRHRSDTLEKKLQRYEIILAQTENVLFEWDKEKDEITFSDTWKKIFGFEPINQLLQQRLTENSHFHPDDLPLMFDKIANLENGSNYEMTEVRIATDKGRYLWCRIRATAVRDSGGKLQKISGIIINIDAEKQAEKLLQSRAEQDSLTKLLNKDAARKQAEEYFARFPEGVSSALMIIDLDDFKQVNDQYGHLFGDAVLTQVAREIKKLFRSQDIVARIGGDEFLVLMRGVSDRTLLEQRGHRLIQIFRSIFQNRRVKLQLSCSIGIALSPEHGRSYYELYQQADRALYQAKAKGKNCFIFYNGKDTDFLTQPGRTAAVSNPIDSDTEPGMADDNIVRYAFQRLYASRDVEGSVNDILAMIGRKMNVSRVYVFENSEDNRFCSNTYEWCNEGIRPEIQNLQNISYDTDIPGYADNFNEQGIFYCPDITILPKTTYDIVAAQGIKSMLHCAIRENGVFRGYIGFDECVEQRLWTKEQIALLSFFSESLSMFLLRQRRQEKVQQQADELSSILDNQNAWIYIVDPDTYRLKYANAQLKEQIPDIRPGMCCYKVLKGRSEPCTYCPALQIREEKNNSIVNYNEHFRCHVLIEATRIHWDGTESWLMTSRKLPDMGK